MKLAFISLGLLFILALAFFGRQSQQRSQMPLSSPIPSTQPVTDSTLKQFKKAENVLQSGQAYRVILTTTAGDIIVELDTINTPITANNFVYLTQQGFYDNTVFHRIINGFMIQGGDPLGNGTGGPGYKFADEAVTKDYTRGTIAMANSGPNTNGSQFFIMHADYPLPKNYVIFGQVISGLETVDKIAAAPVKTSPGGEKSLPVNPIKIIRATVETTPVN